MGVNIIMQQTIGRTNLLWIELSCLFLIVWEMVSAVI